MGTQRRHPPVRLGDPESLYVRLFALYVKRFLRRSFHGVRIAREGLPPQRVAGPLVIYLNHPSWWDPLLALVVARRYFHRRRHLAIIESGMAERYRILEPLGFAGVDAGTAGGARRFLELADAVLARDDSVLWLTPHGRFVDARDRFATFAGGLARVARRSPSATFLPLALEYTFWDERLPEALLRFGEPLSFDTHGGTDRQVEAFRLEATLRAALHRTQDELARLARDRELEPFDSLLDGRVGVGGVYDAWRRLRSWIAGRRFDPAHSLADEGR